MIMKTFKDLKIGDYVYTITTFVKESLIPPKLDKLIVNKISHSNVGLLWASSGTSGPTITVDLDSTIYTDRYYFNYFSDIKIANKYYIEECKKYLSKNLDEAKRLEEKLVDILSIHLEISDIIENLEKEEKC